MSVRGQGRSDDCLIPAARAAIFALRRFGGIEGSAGVSRFLIKVALSPTSGASPRLGVRRTAAAAACDWERGSVRDDDGRVGGCSVPGSRPDPHRLGNMSGRGEGRQDPTWDGVERGVKRFNSIAKVTRGSVVAELGRPIAFDGTHVAPNRPHCRRLWLVWSSVRVCRLRAD